MAQVTWKTHQHVDWLLDYLLSEWETVSEAAAEWDDWDDQDRHDFLAEWPIKEESLRELEQLASKDLLTTEQAERYQALRRYIDTYRPVLNTLFCAARTP